MAAAVPIPSAASLFHLNYSPSNNTLTTYCHLLIIRQSSHIDRNSGTLRQIHDSELLASCERHLVTAVHIKCQCRRQFVLYQQWHVFQPLKLLTLLMTNLDSYRVVTFLKLHCVLHTQYTNKCLTSGSIWTLAMLWEHFVSHSLIQTTTMAYNYR